MINAQIMDHVNINGLV